MIRITPCKDCTDRYENCHSKCDQYKAWRSELDAEREKMIEVKVKNADLVRRRNDAIRKVKRDHRSHRN